MFSLWFAQYRWTSLSLTILITESLRLIDKQIYRDIEDVISIQFLLFYFSHPMLLCLSVVSHGSKQQNPNHDIFDYVGKMNKAKCDMLVIHEDDGIIISGQHSK